MMNNFDPTTLENSFCDAIRTAGVSANVFPNRPRSLDANLQDFVVCHVNGEIRDRCAIGECVFFVALYARDVKNIKNGAKLSIMQTKLKGIAPTFGNVVLKPFTFSPNGDIPDKNGYHVRIFYINAFVKPDTNTD